MKIHKIPLEGLLDILEDLYDQGVNYIDITGEVNDDESQDVIWITVEDDYIEEDDNEDYDADIQVEDNRDLSNDDLNNLISL